MRRNRCPRCGLINRDLDEVCRRCAYSLTTEDVADSDKQLHQEKQRSIGKRLVWILLTTLLALSIVYISLLVTSDDLNHEQRETVENAITVLENKGFHKQSFILGKLVKYRASDNWWNRYLGHHDAYAATNFPFEVVTVYPEFFQHTTDDIERAAILLHESYHLMGSNEATALEGVWREKERIGWTANNYSQTKVWLNTSELTANEVPSLFQCGPDGHSDCTIDK